MWCFCIWFVSRIKTRNFICGSCLWWNPSYSIERVRKYSCRYVLEESKDGLGDLSIDEFNALAYQTNDFDVDEAGNHLGDDGIISSYPPSFIKNRLKEEETLKKLTKLQEEEGLTEGMLRKNTRKLSRGGFIEVEYYHSRKSLSHQE